MGHFVSSEREGQGRKRNRNESEETEEMDSRPNCISVGRPSDVRYAPSHHPTTPIYSRTSIARKPVAKSNSFMSHYEILPIARKHNY